jgi:hypothetical protein
LGLAAFPPLPLDRPGSKSLEEAPVPLGASSIFMTESSFLRGCLGE